MPEFGGFQIVTGGSEHTIYISELPLAYGLIRDNDFSGFNDSPACLERFDNEIAESDNRAESK